MERLYFISRFQTSRLHACIKTLIPLVLEVTNNNTFDEQKSKYLCEGNQICQYEVYNKPSFPKNKTVA